MQVSNPLALIRTSIVSDCRDVDPMIIQTLHLATPGGKHFIDISPSNANFLGANKGKYLL